MKQHPLKDFHSECVMVKERLHNNGYLKGYFAEYFNYFVGEAIITRRKCIRVHHRRSDVVESITLVSVRHVVQNIDTYSVGLSICSPRDNFSYRHGRVEALYNAMLSMILDTNIKAVRLDKFKALYVAYPWLPEYHGITCLYDLPEIVPLSEDTDLTE